MLGFVLVATSLTGYISDVRSHWTADGSRIVTEATLHTEGGDITISQFGGTAIDPDTGEKLTMREMPGSEVLVDGMRVAVEPTFAMDLSWRMHVIVDSVKVVEYPSGFVRTGPTKSGTYLYWESGCVFITVDSEGTKEIAGENEFPVVSESIATWNDNTASCSYIQLLEEGRKPVETGRDRVNIIKFRDASWCRPKTKDDPARCHPESAAGITTATYVDDAGSERDGAIVDSDIELNGVNFSISVNGQTLGTEPCGHLLGLEHTCLAAGDPPRVDDKNNPVPTCTQAMNNMVITGATMFNYQACGEVTKVTLEADDINAICTIYPTARDPGTCEPVGDDGGCCETGGRSAGSSLVLALAVLTGFWRPRRRAR
jgi:hypothetical protein